MNKNLLFETVGGEHLLFTHDDGTITIDSSFIGVRSFSPGDHYYDEVKELNVETIGDFCYDLFWDH